eukprot:3590828-Karenia_brevis.AAC.1
MQADQGHEVAVEVEQVDAQCGPLPLPASSSSLFDAVATDVTVAPDVESTNADLISFSAAISCNGEEVAPRASHASPVHNLPSAGASTSSDVISFSAAISCNGEE